VGHLIVTQDMHDDAVNRSIRSPALLVSHTACITETGEDEAMDDDAPDLVLVARQPNQGADCGGYE